MSERGQCAELWVRTLGWGVGLSPLRPRERWREEVKGREGKLKVIKRGATCLYHQRLGFMCLCFGFAAACLLHPSDGTPANALLVPWPRVNLRLTCHCATCAIVGGCRPCVRTGKGWFTANKSRKCFFVPIVV